MRITPQQIEAWVKKNFQYKMASGGKQIRINNPFDNDDDYHMWVSLSITPLKKGPHIGKKNYWVHDFRGTYASSFVGFVKRYLNTNYRQAVSAVVGEKVDPSFYLREDEEVKEEIETILELPQGSKPIIGDKESRARMHAINYLEGRCVNLEKIEKYNIYYTVSSVVFPYFEYGNIVYWQERNLLNKIFMFPDSSTGANKTDFLYGFDMVNPESTIYIVESIFNCISIGDSCLASGGAVLAGEQLNRLKMLRPKKIVLAPDNDKAGISSLIKNYYQIKEICPIFYSLPPKPDDWNDIEQKTKDSRRIMLENEKKLDLLASIKLQELLARLSK